MLHNERRREILRKHPTIQQLYDNDISLCVPMLFVWILQMTIASQSSDFSWNFLCIMAYVVGGALSQNIFLANHELSHNHVFRKPFHNKIFSVMMNIPIGIPYTSFFQKYHQLHHTHLGHYGLDTDLPSNFEVQMIQSAFKKIIWMFFQIIAYAIRPMLICPLPMDCFDVCVISFISLTNVLIFMCWSIKAYIYLLLSVLFGGGLHPFAGHFIAEHYVFKQKQETYSYYGMLNYFTYNVGYHNEHHDFPRVPGSLLPRVRAKAAEFYEPLQFHTSWCKVMWNFITKKTIDLSSRKIYFTSFR